MIFRGGKIARKRRQKSTGICGFVLLSSFSTLVSTHSYAGYTVDSQNRVCAWRCNPPKVVLFGSWQPLCSQDELLSRSRRPKIPVFGLTTVPLFWGNDVSKPLQCCLQPTANLNCYPPSKIKGPPPWNLNLRSEGKVSSSPGKLCCFLKSSLLGNSPAKIHGYKWAKWAQLWISCTIVVTCHNETFYCLISNVIRHHHDHSYPAYHKAYLSVLHQAKLVSLPRSHLESIYLEQLVFANELCLVIWDETRVGL